MEFIIIAIIAVILSVILGILFGYNLKKVKKITENKELDEKIKKYPNNIEICKSFLKKLNNEKVKVEENSDNEASLYIAVTNKILIANISNTYTRIQTIAHECLHSVQNRKILMFNFIFSNIYILYYITICVLAIFKILPNKLVFLSIYLLLSLVYYMVRIYLENDAMINAKYLAKEYMVKMFKWREYDELQQAKEEINKIVKKFGKINDIGIRCVNYKFFLNIIVKLLIFLGICIVR